MKNIARTSLIIESLQDIQHTSKKVLLCLLCLLSLEVEKTLLAYHFAC